MIRATYDTNTLVSGATISQGPISFIMNAWINDDVEMVTSEPLINELSRTLEKPYFASRLTQKQARSFVNLVRDHAIIVRVTTPIPKAATHPEDDIVLATADSGKASYIVTGDHGLQSLGRFKTIRIVDPRTFGEFLQAESVAK